MVKQAGKDKQRPWALALGLWSELGLQGLHRETLGPLGHKTAGPGVLGHRQRATTTVSLGQGYGPGTKGLPQGHWAREYWARDTGQRHETTRPENWTRAPMRYWAHRAAGPGRHSTTVVPHCYNYTARLVTYTWQR